MEKIVKDYENVVAEMRSMLTKGSMTADEKNKFDELEARSKELRASIEAEKRVKEMETELRGVNFQTMTVAPAADLRSKLLNAASEKRSVNIGGTGAESILPEIVKALSVKKDVLGKLKFVNGKDSKTKIPVLSAYPAVADGLDENAAISADDASNILDAIYLEPKAASINLPVSAEALYLSGVNVNSQLPGIFAEGFAETIYNGFLTGTGTKKMTGIFADARITQKVEFTAGASPTWLDLAKLASKIRARTDNGALFVPDVIINNILGSEKAGHEMIKNEYMVKGTIRGVQVVEVPMDRTFAAGEISAIAMPFDNYAYTVIDAFDVTPIMTKDSTTTYFRALSFIDGKIVNPLNVWKLTAK